MPVKYPFSVWRPLGAQTQPRMKAFDIVCLHTMVGYLSSTDAMFKRSGYGGTESHFGVGGKWGGDIKLSLDGIVYQWQDLDYTADANFEGNSRIISIETADNAPQSASNLDAWTPKQLDAIVKLVAWLCKRYNIPPFLVRDSKPGRRGIAVHRQGIEHGDGVNSHPGWLVSGGERWSTARGKECPGNARIKQVTGIVIPRVQDILNGDELDMDEATVLRLVKQALTDTTTVNTLADKLFKADVIQAPDADLVKDPKNPTWAMRSYLNRLNSVSAANVDKFASLQRAIDALPSKIQTSQNVTDALAEIQRIVAEIRDSVVPTQP